MGSPATAQAAAERLGQRAVLARPGPGQKNSARQGLAHGAPAGGSRLSSASPSAAQTQRRILARRKPLRGILDRTLPAISSQGQQVGYRATALAICDRRGFVENRKGTACRGGPVPQRRPRLLAAAQGRIVPLATGVPTAVDWHRQRLRFQRPSAL